VGKADLAIKLGDQEKKEKGGGVETRERKGKLNSSKNKKPPANKQALFLGQGISKVKDFTVKTPWRADEDRPCSGKRGHGKKRIKKE